MAEFTKKLSDVRVPQAAQLQGGNSTAGDIIQGASFLFDVYRRGEALEERARLESEAVAEEERIKAEEMEITKSVENIKRTYTDLAMNDKVSDFRLENELENLIRKEGGKDPLLADRLRKEIQSWRKSPTTASSIRKALKEEQEALEQESSVESAFNLLKGSDPAFVIANLPLGAEDVVSEETMAKIVNSYNRMTSERDSADKQEKNALLEAKKANIKAASEYSKSTRTKINSSLPTLLNSFSKAITNIGDLGDDVKMQTQSIQQLKRTSSEIIESYVQMVNLGASSTVEAFSFSNSQDGINRTKFYQDNMVRTLNSFKEAINSSDFDSLKQMQDTLATLVTEGEMDAFEALPQLMRIRAVGGNVAVTDVLRTVGASNPEAFEPLETSVAGEVESYFSLNTPDQIGKFISYGEGVEVSPQDSRNFYVAATKTSKRPVDSLSEGDKDLTAKNYARYFSDLVEGEVEGIELVVDEIVSPSFQTFKNALNPQQKAVLDATSREVVLKALSDTQSGILKVVEDAKLNGWKFEVSSEGKVKLLPQTTGRPMNITLRTKESRINKNISNINKAIDIAKSGDIDIQEDILNSFYERLISNNKEVKETRRVGSGQMGERLVSGGSDSEQ